MKKIVFIFSLMLCINAKADDVTIVAQSDSNDASTKCGDNCTWTLYSNGKLEIKGTGDMYDFGYDGEYLHRLTTAPWRDILPDVTSVTIDEGISYVGARSFTGGSFTHLDLPTSTTNIGDFAFADSSLETVNTLQNVTTIAYAAFFNSNLTHADLSDDLMRLESDVFGYTDLTELHIPDKVNYIGPWAFLGTGIQNFIIPDGVTTIEHAAFHSIPNDAKIYCQNTPAHVCNELINENTLGEDKIQLFTHDSGVYKLEDGTMFASPNDMMKGENACSNLDSCKATVLKNKGYCSSDESCMAMVDLENANAPIEYKNKSYASIDDLLKGKYMPKRIYTLEEANAVAGDKNRVSIKYR